MNEVLEMLSANRIQNFDNIIEVSPLSYDVKIYKKKKLDINAPDSDSFDLFGYKDELVVNTINTKAIIEFAPSKAFLYKVGLFHENTLPILAFFKSSDNVEIYDEVEVIFKDVRKVNINYTNIFKVINILSMNFIAVYVYRLAPVRK